jgi:hypothetical protein
MGCPSHRREFHFDLRLAAARFFAAGVPGDARRTRVTICGLTYPKNSARRPAAVICHR